MPKFEVTLRDKATDNRRTLITTTPDFGTAERAIGCDYDEHEEIIKIEKEYEYEYKEDTAEGRWGVKK